MRSFHPANPSAGNNVSATLIRQLIAEVKASRVIPGPGVSVRRMPSGTHVSANAGWKGGGSSRTFWNLTRKEDGTFEWKGKYLQIGMRFYNYDALEGHVTDNTDGEDGTYWVDIELGHYDICPIEIKKDDYRAADPVTNRVGFLLGAVVNGKLLQPLPFVPVIYVNL